MKTNNMFNINDKPLLFVSACFFSIAASSISFLTMLIATLFFKPIIQQISELTNISAVERLNSLYFAVLMSAFAISLAGAIKMLMLKRSGFYFYIVGQSIVLFFPVLWIGLGAFSVTNAIFTSIILIVYISYFRILK